jgi:hypothetical protein
MPALINADRSMLFAAQANILDGAPVARNHPLEPSVNAMIDRKPQSSPVAHPRLSVDNLPSNQRAVGKVRQVWASGAHFPNAHAFPDNPLRTAEDYLFR